MQKHHQLYESNQGCKEQDGWFEDLDKQCNCYPFLQQSWFSIWPVPYDTESRGTTKGKTPYTLWTYKKFRRQGVAIQE